MIRGRFKSTGVSLKSNLKPLGFFLVFPFLVAVGLLVLTYSPNRAVSHGQLSYQVERAP